MINILSLISFANAVFFMFLSIYSIVSVPKSPINQASAMECFLLAIWTFSYTFFYVAPTKEAAWFWLRIGSIGWSSFMSVLVWFFLALGRNNRKRYSVCIKAFLGIYSIVLIILNIFAPYTSAAVDLIPNTSGFGWTYHNRIDNGLYWLYVVYILIGFVLSVKILVNWLKDSSSKHFIKLAIAFCTLDGALIAIGFISDLIIPFFTDEIPPLTNVFLIIFCFSYWVIIFKLDVFKKTSLEDSEVILDTISDALLVLDQRGEISYCNKATGELLQYNTSEIIGKKLLYFFKNGSYNSANVNELREKKKLTSRETELVAKDGTIIHTNFSASIAEDDIHGFIGIIVSFHDITKQKKLEKKMFELAHYDSLTGLPNRRYFWNMLYTYEELYQSNKQDFAILFMDLDGFKNINDTMGHDKGDELLVEVGRRINICCDDADIVARIGGDEFVMLQAKIKTKDQIEERMQKIQQQFDHAIIISEQECPVGISIGYALYSETKGITQMMKKADQQMYVKKNFIKKEGH